MEWRAGEDQGDLGSVFSENLQSQTTVPGSVCQFTACERTGESKGKAGSCGSCLDLAVLAEGLPDSLGKSLQFLGIKAAELSCLGSHMPVADKLAESDLFCLGSSLIIKGCFFVYFSRRERGSTMKLTRMEGSSSLKKEPI